MIPVAEEAAERLQRFLEEKFGVRIPILVTHDYRAKFSDPTIWVLRSMIGDPDGGMDLTEHVFLKEFVRPDSGQSYSLEFAYHQIGPSNEIDQWDVRISGADESDRQPLYEIFDARPWLQHTGWGGWGRHLVPVFEFNGARSTYAPDGLSGAP